MVHPLFYGVGGVSDFAWHVNNHPNGFIAIPSPRTLGAQGFFSIWAVTIDAAAKTEARARLLAEAIQARLLGTPRHPTAFEFLGDTAVGNPANGYKYVLTFSATFRQGE